MRRSLPLQQRKNQQPLALTPPQPRSRCRCRSRRPSSSPPPQISTLLRAVHRSELEAKREEFWFTQPSYGGRTEIWSALKAVVETEDIDTARLFVESAGIIVATPHLTVAYDELGNRYELPEWVLADPVNVVSDPARESGEEEGIGRRVGNRGRGETNTASQQFQVVV